MRRKVIYLRVGKLPVSFLAIITAIFILIGVGCNSGELSRSQVQSLVEASPDFSQPAVIDLKNYFENKSACTERASADETLEQAKARDLKQFFESYPTFAAASHLGFTDVEQTLIKEDKYFPPNTFARPCWQLTDKFRASEKGKQLWEAMNLPVKDDALPTGRKQFGTVSGITKQGETQALADFTYQWQPNELGKALDENTEEFKSLPSEIQKTLSEKKGLLHAGQTTDWGGERQGKALFQKYDDGWRLVRVF